jgi:hypothetical protein
MASIKTTQQGLQDGWTRATFILRKSHLKELKALAHWERKTIKELLDGILNSYLLRSEFKEKGGS